MSALRQQRMNVVFDALIAAGDVGATKHDLYDAMVDVQARVGCRRCPDVPPSSCR